MGEAIVRWAFAVAAKKQSHSLEPCLTAGWLWGTVMPRRGHTGQVRAPDDFHHCFNSCHTCFGVFFDFLLCLDNINTS